MVRGDNVSVCFTQRYHGSFKVVELQTQNFIIRMSYRYVLYNSTNNAEKQSLSLQ